MASLRVLLFLHFLFAFFFFLIRTQGIGSTSGRFCTFLEAGHSVPVRERGEVIFILFFC